MREAGGVLVLYKPAGYTSHDAVNRIRKFFNTRRVGHTGTLDPDATGVLVVLVGRAAKAEEYLASHEKSYRARLRLGVTTDTQDASGTVLTRCDSLPDAARVKAVCRTFVGDILQIPPMYSALKVNGRKLVDLARKGQTVEREARPVTVFSLDVTPTEQPDEYILDVACSGGTYIRTLCADIGDALGCGGIMASLLRTRTGRYSLDDCTTLETLEAMSPEEREARLLPTETLFDDYPALPLPAFFERLSRSGCEIYQKKIGTDFPLGTRVRMATEDGRFFALGEVREYESGSAVKAIKLFDLET